MEVIEKSAEGLDRQFEVKVPAAELEEKLVARLNDIKGQVQLKGFRKGKAPISFLKKLYGKGVMGEIVQELVAETSQKAFEERDLRLATQPNPQISSNMDDVFSGAADLEYSFQAEILPTFEPMDVSELSLVRPVADVPAEDLDDALQKIAEQQTTYEPREGDAPAQDGDMVSINFVGRLDDEEFEGGKGEGVDLVLGSGSFIPGFEEPLVGAKPGDEVKVEVTFPEDYRAENLAGKDAVFDVEVLEVKAPETVELDDELAKKLGLEGLDDLKTRVEDRLKGEFSQQSRAHVKRALLDKLDEAHDFELPKTMVNMEFDQIWNQVQAAEPEEEDKDKSEDELKEEYRKISERRVRLGLVLAEIGRKADVQVPTNELQTAIQQQAMRESQMMAMQGQQIDPQEVLKFYQQNPQVIQQIRAPLFEEKVVDYILERASVEDKTVSKDELMQDPEGEDAFAA
ncbi:MAG: trigger factor [Pseudomonadota bacterium]